MRDGPRRQVRLRGGPEGSVSWVRLLEGGSVQAEMYDFGEEAQAHFGNDVAFLLIVAPSGRSRMEEELLPGYLPGGTTARDERFLRAVEACFPDFFELKGWLGAMGIPFQESFDSRA